MNEILSKKNKNYLIQNKNHNYNFFFVFVILILIILSSYAFFFINSWEISSIDKYSWPNLNQSNINATDPSSEYEKRLLDGFKQYLDVNLQNYNEDLGMIVSGISQNGNIINAHTRTQFRTALACFALSDLNETYITIANELLRNSYLYFQERTPSSGYRTFGNFFWTLGDGKVEDLNAGPFNSIILGYIFYSFPDLIDNDVRLIWEDGMAAIISTCVHRLDSPSYTNIHLLRTAGLLTIGRYLNDRSAIKLGMQFFYEWKRYTQSIGLSEYTTINYLQVSLRAIMAIWEFAPTQEFADDVLPFLNYLWMTYLIQENNGNMGGPHSRDYEYDYFYGGGIRQFINHFIYPAYPNEGTEKEFLSLYNWKPDQKLINLANNRTYPYNVEYRYGNIFAQAYFEEEFSLSAQSGTNPNGEIGSQTIPIYATLNTSEEGINVGNNRNSIFFIDNNGYRNLRTTSVQYNNSLLTGFYFDSKDEDTAKDVGVLGYLGNASAINSLRINNTDYSLINLLNINQFGSNSVLSYSIGEVYIGIKFWNSVVKSDVLINKDTSSLFISKDTNYIGRDWNIERENELILYLDGLNSYSGVLIQIYSRNDWNNFSEFSDTFNTYNVNDDINLISNNREIFTIINSTTLNASTDLNSGNLIFQKINGTETDRNWIFNSPWIKIAKQNIPYKPSILHDNEYYIYVVLIIMIFICTIILLVPQIKSTWSIYNSRYDLIVSNIVFIILMVLILILTIIDVNTWFFVIIVSILVNTYGISYLIDIKGIKSAYKLKEDTISEDKNRITCDIFKFSPFEIIILSCHINLLVFLILTLATKFFAWTHIIFYCVTFIIFGLNLLTRSSYSIDKSRRNLSNNLIENQNTKIKNKEEIFKIVFFSTKILLALMYITFGVLLLVDTEELEFLQMILSILQIIISIFIISRSRDKNKLKNQKNSLEEKYNLE